MVALFVILLYNASVQSKLDTLDNGRCTMHARNSNARLFVVILIFVSLLAGLVGCSGSDDSSAVTPADTRLVKLDNDLEGGKTKIETPVPGEKYRFEASYSTDYETDSWRITKPKTIRMQAKVIPIEGGEGLVAYIEHVHVDISLLGKKAGLDGLLQDSMDDSLHSGTQPGFLATGGRIYEEVFSIEGFSKTLIDGWGYQTQTWSESEITEKRLTENALRDEGVYGNKLTVVYDVVVQYPGDPGYSKRVVVQEFAVPIGEKKKPKKK